MKKTSILYGLSIALTLAACSSNKSTEAYQDESADSSTTASTLSNNEAESKLVKTADLDFKVKDVYKTNQHLYRATKELGGLVVHNKILNNPGASKSFPLSKDSIQVISTYNIEAEMTVKVPSNKLNDFISTISNEAIIIATAQLDIEDKGLEYLENQLKTESRNKILDKELRKDTLKTAGIMDLAAEKDHAIEKKIENLRINGQVKYSNISLHYFQNPTVEKESVVNSEINHYDSPYFLRLSNALQSGLSFFLDVLIALLHLWPFIITSLSIWFGIRLWKKQRNNSTKQA